MSSATKFKLGILTLLLVLLGGKLLGDTVNNWSIGNEKGVINLPAAAMQNQNTIARAGPSYSYGYRMGQIENGTRLVTPSAMMGCYVVAMTAGLLIDVTTIDGNVVILGETLIALRDNGVLSFSLRIIDIEENYIEVKFVLVAGAESYDVLVK